jgi:hypothetical protein
VDKARLTGQVGGPFVGAGFTPAPNWLVQPEDRLALGGHPDRGDFSPMRTEKQKTLTIAQIRANQEIMSCLNLEMTPERAVSLYLEWGSSWAHGRDFIRSGHDVSCYLRINAWTTPAKVVLVRQSTSDEKVMGEVDVPVELVDRAVRSWGNRKGTYGLSEELKGWFQTELFAI